MSRHGWGMLVAMLCTALLGLGLGWLAWGVPW